MPRGRLIFPFQVEIAQLDTTATNADPDGAGPLTSGYDDDFKEPALVPSGTTAPPSKPREESVITTRAQIEDESFEQLEMLATGRSPTGQVILVFHFQVLELEGLVDGVTGEALIRVTDRLQAIRRWPGGDLVQTIRTPPGLYCVEAMPRSFGLAVQNAHRNLLVCTFEPRDLSAAR